VGCFLDSPTNNNFNPNRFNMKKIIFLLAFLFATITNAQTPARHYGGVILGSFASDPTGVSAGQIYWNTTDNKFRVFDGTVWTALVSDGLIFPNREIVFGNGTGVESNSNIQANGNAGYIRLTDGTNTSNLYSNRTEIRDNTNVYGSLFKDNIRFYDGTAFTQQIYAGVVTANRVLTMPDASGTIALTSDLLNLDLQDVTDADNTITNDIEIQSNIGISKTFKVYRDINTNEFAQMDYDELKINSSPNSNTIMADKMNLNTTGFYTHYKLNGIDAEAFGSNYGLSLDFNNTTATSSYTQTFQQASGTIALTSDITDVSEWAESTGTRSGGDLLVTLGDYDNSDIGTKLIIDNANDYVKIESGNGLFSSQGFNIGTNPLSTFGSLQTNALTSNRVYDFPDASGTIALTSDIPTNTNYVDLTSAQSITGDKTFNDIIVNDQAGSTDYRVDVFSGQFDITNTIAGNIFRIQNNSLKLFQTTSSGGFMGSLDFSNITSNRSYAFPNATGTIALTSDIPTSTDYVDLTTAQTISGDKTFSGTNDVTGSLRIFDNDNFDVSGFGAISQTMKKDTDASGTQVMTYDRITYDGTPSGSTQGKYNYYRYQGQSQSTNAWHNVNYYRVEDDEDNNTSVLPNSSLQNYNQMYQRSSGTGQNISGEFGNNINRQYWDSGYGGGYMDEAYNVFNILSYDNSDWTTGEWWSNTNKVEATAGTITNLKGVSQTIDLSGTVNNSNLYGFYFDYSNTSSGTQPTNAFAFYNDSSLPILSDGDIEISNNRKLLIEDTGGDFTDYDTSFAVAPVWESGHSDAVKIGKYNKLLVEQNASSTQYWNYNDVRLNGNTNANRYDMNWTGSYYNGTGGFSEGTTHSLNQMFIKNTTTGTRDFGFFYNQNNIINVDDFDGGTVATTVEDYMTLFNQSNINDDNITINDHWLNLNQLNYEDGSIGELYGLNVDFNISGSADVTTTNHLINLEYTNSSSGTVATPYAIYSASDIPSFHRGDIEIGSGSNISMANGDITTANGDVFVASGKVYTGGSGGSATIEQDDLKLVRGFSGDPQVTATSGGITHAINFDLVSGSNTTLSTPNGYVGQIAVAHEKTPQIETGSSGGTTNSTDGKDFYYLKWTGGNGNETFNLPNATTNQYRTLQFITNSTVTANTTWTLDAFVTQTIDGSATYTINRAYEGIKLWSDGTEWIIIQAKK